MPADAAMMGTTTTDKYLPSADLFESVGVKAMKLCEPTTTLSALLGFLLRDSRYIVEFHAPSAITMQMSPSLPDSRAKGLGGIRRCFPSFNVLRG